MSAFDAFFEGLRAVVSVEIEKDYANNPDGALKVIKNRLFNLPDEKSGDVKHTRDQQMFYRVWWSFIEIHATYQALLDHEIYMARFPFRKTRLTPPRHLRHVIESYLNEIYILYERINAFLTILERLYRADARGKAIAAESHALRESAGKALKTFVNVRGGHIHKARFHNDDLLRLDALDSLLRERASDDVSRSLKPYYATESRRIRTFWKQHLSRNNTNAKELLDTIFSKLQPHVFTRDGQFRYAVPANRD